MADYLVQVLICIILILVVTLFAICVTRKKKLMNIYFGIVPRLFTVGTLFEILEIDNNVFQCLSKGGWLTLTFNSWANNNWIKSMIVIIAWLKWKEHSQVGTIISRAWSLCSDFFLATKNTHRDSSKPHSHSNHILVYTTAS